MRRLTSTVAVTLLLACTNDATSADPAVCDDAAAVFEACDEVVDDAFWERCQGDPASYEEVVSIGCDPGKADIFGNRGEYETCWADWLCASDMGLVCRPVDALKRDSYRCQTPGTETGEVDTFGGTQYCGGLCDEDEDCADGFICLGDRDTFGSDRGERAGACVAPDHTPAPHSACP